MVTITRSPLRHTCCFMHRFISTIGNIFASSLAKRIGLIRAMVATHLPSSVFLGLLPAPAGLASTICLLVARAVLNSMDQAPRSALLSILIPPEERTAVIGVVNTLKILSQSGGPWITGLLADHGRFWAAFAAAGSLKGAYDVLLLILYGGRSSVWSCGEAGPAEDSCHADLDRADAETGRNIVEDESDGSSAIIPCTSPERHGVAT
jgi:sugar phosphate permease